MSSPGIVLVSKFVSSKSKKFQNYVDYVDRDEAVRNKNFKNFNALEFDGYNHYMGNPLKTQGLFTSDKSTLTAHEKKELKQLFEKAQKKDSVMWQDVISFENAWLEKNGFYTPKTHWLNETAIQNAIREGMRVALKEEGLDATAIWSAAIHINTGNIHVHVAMVEPEPTKPYQQFIDKKTGKAYTARRGSRKKTTLDKFKSKVANSLLDRDRELSKISELIHKRMAPSKLNLYPVFDRETLKLFNEINASLPPDMRLWKYNNNALNEIRPMMDAVIKKYLEHNHPDELKALDAALKKEMNFRKEVYGDGEKEVERYKDYQTNKYQELYTKLGNALLREMKEIRKEERQKESSGYQKQGPFLQNNGLGWRTSIRRSRLMQRDMNRMRRALNHEYQSYKNRRKYEELQRDMERGR